MPSVSLSDLSASPYSSSAGSLPPQTPPTTLGVFLIGCFIGILLYGLSIHQAYKYARSFPFDSLFIKMLVIIVMLFETLHTVLTMHVSYHYLITNYYNPTSLLHGVWSLDIIPVFSGVVILTSQLFSARRVALIGCRQRIVVGIAVFFLAAEVALAAVGSAIAFLFDRRTIVAGITVIALGLATAGDALLSGSLVHAIKKSRAGKDLSSESPVDRLQLYSVNTGLVTSVFNMVSFILAATTPSELTYVTLTIITTRLYANCMLSVLNDRQLKIAGMEIFVDNNSQMTLSNAELDATKELWNVPKLAEDDEPQFIRVEVTTEKDKDYGRTPGRLV